ncbi:MAG: hypothetical protein AAGA50_14980 [Pseudomonadota bacterium]
MLRTFSVFLLFITISFQVSAGGYPQSGRFEVINSDGFVQQNGTRTRLKADRDTGIASIEHASGDSLLLGINGSSIRLFPIENGLAALEWNSGGTTLLHDADILALLDTEDPSNVAVWGADLAWPGTIGTQLVLFTLRPNAYAGFLISETKSKTIVRQMEFRQIFGPANRPQASARSNLASKN